jgi:hypothetical protein
VSLQPIHVLVPRGKRQRALVLDDIFEGPIGGQPHGQSGRIKDQLVDQDTFGNARHRRARKPTAECIVPVMTARSTYTQAQRGKAAGPPPVPTCPITAIVAVASTWLFLLLLKALAQPVAGTGYRRTGQTFGDHRITFQTGCVPLDKPPHSSRLRRIICRIICRRRRCSPPAAGGCSHRIRVRQHTAVAGRAGTGTRRMVVPVAAANAATTAKRGCRVLTTMYQQDVVTLQQLPNSSLRHHPTGAAVSSVITAMLLRLQVQMRPNHHRTLEAATAAGDAE